MAPTKVKLLKSLRFKIILSSLLLSLSPILIFSYLAISASTDTLLNNIKNELKEKSFLVGGGIDRFVHQREIDIKILSQADVLESKNTQAIIQYLSEVTKESKYLHNINIVDLGGSIILSSGTQNEKGKNISSVYPQLQSLFKQVLLANQGDVFVSEAMQLKNGLGLAFLTPVTDDTNTRVISVLMTEVSLNSIKKIVSEFDKRVIGDKYVYLVDNNGLVIISDDPSVKTLEILPDFRVDKRLEKIFKDEGEIGAIEYIDTYGDKVIAGFADMNQFGKNQALDWSIISIAPIDAILEPVYELRNVLLSIISALVLIVSFISVYFSSKLSSILIFSTKIVQKISMGDLKENFTHIRCDEIGHLQIAINQIIKNSLQIQTQAESIAIGDFSNKIELRSKDDNLSSALIKMNESLNTLVSQANQISEGNLDIHIQAKSDKDQLGIALSKMTETLIKEKENALEMSKLKADFLASMSHEIRTPMNGVLGMLGLLLKSNLDNKQRNQAQLAHSSAENLLSLINDILDFSKVESGKLELEFISFNLIKLFDDFTEITRYKAEEKGISLQLDIENISEVYVKGDPHRLRQILNNLVSNAVKFTSIGQVSISASMKEDYILHIKINDTGIGIPEDKFQHLFESFSQVDTSTTRKYGGTGLGLAISKELCELMGGEIKVSSIVGTGSCFEFNIKLQQSDEEIKCVPNVNINGLSVLIVDSDKTNAEVLKQQLESWGCLVNTVRTTSQALDLCQTNALDEEKNLFDMALIDNEIPDIGAIELAKTMNGDTNLNSIKLMMISSGNEDIDLAVLKEVGFSAYFIKPLTASDLFNTMSVIMDNSEILQGAKPLLTQVYLHTLKNEEIRPAKNIQNSNILLVEDNEVNRLVLLGILEEYNMTADIAVNGKEAIDMLKDSDYAIVLMDCQMPIMDGYEATKRIRKEEAGAYNKDIIIVALTANAMAGDKEKCLKAGMSDYISKPIEAKILYKTLTKYLGVCRSDAKFI